ncbi:VCBS repeat-containing protein [Fibrella forsythiae]|uniref:VCBS repeat-containing protein n=1 Tax=Fibrella forsythiae TaxID=2817061 RepID=A0ABS3JQ93_9BACT|nr:VCBS repeat-containing protein [Fibrella forsythiae]MBO0952167.1 VCBS repeat-containing protein [Fibrella forsythiae]
MKRIISVVLTATLLYACAGQESTEPTLFTLLSSSESGVAFTNTLTETDDLNILNYIYFYNGGGVAVGDVNNDGLSDLYFTANQLPNKLYLNKSANGKLVFEDITAKAGVAGQKGWNTGVTMADVNGDGWLDMYVCQVNLRSQAGANQLFINNAKPGVPTFTEQAAAYGLAHRGYSTQASFFDYDRDGDLDMYLLNHSLRAVGALGDTTMRNMRDPEAGDKLFRNDDNRFVDVSAEMGIRGSKLGYGLGIAVGDINQDGWPDIYVSNDFHENDYLYYNQGNGRGFREGITQSMGHTSNFSMGSDLADFNNDAALDLITLDMQPENEEFVKTSAGADSYDLVQLKTKAGFHFQYPRNALQLNMGNGRGNVPEFSEIAQLAGVYATDWSWSALFSDLDNDGLKDLYITNGIARRPIDLDFFKYIASPTVQASLRNGMAGQRQSLINKMPVVEVPNFAYHNGGDLTFENRAKAWGLDQKGFSNGAAYADLDNDGDLDLVVNNINQAAFIYRNNARQQQPANTYLSVKLAGTGRNTAGIGAKVMVQAAGNTYYQELMPTRGFESAVEPVLTFGLGKTTQLDSITIIWPDAHYQVLRNVKPNQRLTVRQTDATHTFIYGNASAGKPLLTDVSAQVRVNYRHAENQYADFYQEPLMPHLLSTEGPDMAVGDVNGDGLDDFFVGGAKGQSGTLFVQQRNGQFAPTNQTVWQTDRDADDVGAAFFDADGDRDLDLYVVSGGNEPVTNPAHLLDRLYLNDGKGNFAKSIGQLPTLYANGSCVKPADFDRDGDIDLFVGSRSVPGQYGLSPTSYLLENDGKGHFSDAQKTRNIPDLGMVTDAVWADVDRDNVPDLIVVGEWSPVRVFSPKGKVFQEITGACGLANTSGWWNSVVADDMDNDGDTDLIVGNLGLNSQLRASQKEPLLGYFNDLDGNGTFDEILAYYKAGKLYPIAGKDELSAQLVGLKKKFVTYADYAKSDFEGILSTNDLKGAVTRQATLMATCFLQNQGNGTFTVQPLPVEAQLSPVMAILTGDFDADGKKDILLGGNFFGAAPVFGRYDAGHGLFLRGNGSGTFNAIWPQKSGFHLNGEVRDMHRLKTATGNLIMITRNNQPVQVFR